MSAWLLAAARILLALQTTEGAIVGTVRDGESGEPLPGALVALPDVDRAVVSDERGRYALRAVPAGPQHVTVRRIGYTPRTLHALVPRQGELEIDVTLRAAPVTLRTVEVRPAVAIRGAEVDDSADFPDRGISAAAVRHHPLLAEPDVFLAVGGGEVTLSPESPSGVHVRGGAADQTAYLLDGIPVFSPYHAAGTFSAWNPDAIERLRVSSSSASPALPDALSGAVAGATRSPGSRFRTQGAVSSTQARTTVDGPLGVGGAGYLVSARTGFPGVIVPRREPSYLHGESGDLIAKVEAPALGGRARLLAYANENELDAASQNVDEPRPGPGRNEFAWRSRSVGTEWTARLDGTAVRVRGWSASGGADATWHPDSLSPLGMRAERQDLGLLVDVERGRSEVTTRAGVRLQQSRTSYRVTAAGGESPSLSLRARTPMAALFAGHERPLGGRLTADVAISSTAGAGSVYTSPRAELSWRASPLLTVSGSYARSHQFAQSLRNAESVVGSVFPADLFVGARAAGIPVARSDRAVLAAELRPLGGVRLGAQAFVRDDRGLVLVAPRTGDPFAIGALARGAGTSRGISLDAAMSGARYGLLASYGWQHVDLRYADSSYVPDHAARHLIEAGAILFPSATSSIRLGATGALGRRATPVSDAFEWEACNLSDQGCELGGSPRGVTDQLGATKLPPYLRLDLGVRKHWHLSVEGRDAVIGIFGTTTNVLGRKNTLTVATDRSTGEQVDIEMRPRSPLVVGLDWQF